MLRILLAQEGSNAKQQVAPRLSWFEPASARVNRLSGRATRSAAASHSSFNFTAARILLERGNANVSSN